MYGEELYTEGWVRADRVDEEPGVQANVKTITSRSAEKGEATRALESCLHGGGGDQELCLRCHLATGRIYYIPLLLS